MTTYRKTMTEMYQQVRERTLTPTELKRREEIAKDYVTREQMEQTFQRIIDSIERIDEKIDRLQTKTYFQD